MLKRLRHGVRLTALVVGLATTASLAFFIGSFMVDGSHTGTTGSGGTGTKTLPMTVNFEDGKLTPTKSVPLTATFTNTTSKVVKFNHITPTITTGTAGCLPKWFRISSPTSTFWTTVFANPSQPRELEYAPGTHSLSDMVGIEGAPPTFALEMTETEVDQSACESASITVALKLTE